MTGTAQSGSTARRDQANIVGLIRHRDWSATSLGPARSWPARLQHLVELMLRHPLPSFIVCGTDRLLIYNAAFAELCGPLHPQAFGSALSALLTNKEAQPAELVERAFRGEAVAASAHWPMLRVDSHARLVLTPVTDRSLSVAWVSGQIIATPELLRTDDEVRLNERRLRLALEVARLATWDWNMVTGDVVWSDEHFRLEGYPVGEIAPSYDAWASRIHPEDRIATETALAEARDMRRLYDREFRLLRPDGSVVWVSALGQFFYDEGRPVRMIGVMQDVTERRTWANGREVLIAELQHRTRNLIGVVRSLTRKMLNRSSSLEDFMERFAPRLDTLGRIQGLLSRFDEGDRVTFDELLQSELSALGAADEHGSHITLDGPTGVPLAPNTVQTLALAIHELATNAAKYGALRDGGHLLVRWCVEEPADGQSNLNVDWIESGVAMPDAASAPAGGGYGRELIERALPYQLSARTRYELGHDGVRCTIVLPIS